MYYKAKEDITMTDGNILIKNSVISDVSYNGLEANIQALFEPDTETTEGSVSPPPSSGGGMPSGGTPTVVAGTGAGGSGAQAILSPGSDNYRGYITLYPVGAPLLGNEIFRLNFIPALPSVPKAVILTPGGPDTARDSAKYYLFDSNITVNWFAVMNSGTALAGSGTQQWFYHVIL
jgi:hypothetical protein